MTRIHIISDLDLGFNEFTDPIDETIPNDTDLVIINGNIGILKRGMLYAESLAKLYPDVPIVYNLGYLEKYHYFGQKKIGEIEESLFIRSTVNSTWPKNLLFSQQNQIITCRNGFQVDLYTTFGFPFIHQCNINWQDTFYFRNIIAEVTYNHHDERIILPPNSSDVCHGNFPIWATMDWVNQQHKIETDYIRNWELRPTHYKILVTHLNPYKDSRNDGLIVSPHKIHLNEGLWVTSQSKIESLLFLGARLVSNPGRGVLPRSHVVII